MTYLEWKENYRLERIKRNEIWKDIPNYEGLYQVSNLGNVKSLDRVIFSNKRNCNIYLKGIEIKRNISSSGYLMCGLCKNGNQKSFLVHQLIAIAFLGHNPNIYTTVVDHKDNDKLNNNIDNLQLITNRENTSKDKKIGTSKYIGVHWHTRRNKWRATIQINKKDIELGFFNTEEDASHAYQKALELHNQKTISQ